MKQYGGMIVVGVLAVFIGLAISLQASAGQNSDQGGLVPVSQLKPYQAELEKLSIEKENAVQALVKLEERMAQIEKEKAEDDFFLKGVVTDLERYKMVAGVLDVKGPGLSITIDDPLPADEHADQQQYSIIMLRFDLLLSLVNRLKEAGAEAISINGHRIVSTTEIVLAGDNVNINSQPTAPPYRVLAIGNPATMEAAITIKYGVIDTMRTDNGLRVSIEKKEEITVPRYNGTVTEFRYAQPVIQQSAQTDDDQEG